MTEPVKRPKRIYCYGRRGTPLTKEQREKLTPTLPNEVDFIAVELGLEQLDDKAYISITFTTRVIRHLAHDLGVPYEMAQLLVAMRMEYPTYKGFLKSLKDEEIWKQKVAAQREHIRQMENQQWIKERKKKSNPLSATGQGNYGAMGAEFGMRYFFEEKTQYLHLLEEMLKEHRDEYLQIAVDAYPQGKMEWIQYHYSFEEFWRKVNRLNLMDKVDFDEPGLSSIRRLAMYLFTWNFRRYIDGQVIYRHARFLPRLYRHLHIAAMLDKNTVQEVDLEYEETAFEDEDEPGDNIGNR
jgi:hypothetical protein